MLIGLLQDKKVSIDTEKCMKCALCARVCPMQLSPYTDYDDKCQLKSDDCIRCGACVVNCPTQALSFEENRSFTGEPCPHKKKRKEYKAVLEKVEDLTSDVRQFTFKFIEPPKMSFKPGQFLIIKVLDGPIVFRAYSISSTPDECSSVKLAIKKVSDGLGSPLVYEFKEGMEVILEGPMGEFTLQDDTKDVIFVANGIGITPFVSMTKEALKRNQGRVMLLFGVRNEKDIIYDDYFKALKEEYPDFEYILSLTKPSENWKGEKGRVPVLIEKINLQSYDAYLCGSKPMLKDTKEALIKSGIKSERIFFESFF
ncbi:MAG: Anthranilate 1,2-dioxygenase electron transfer component [bacterium ADurb.Bin363]|nr:MAG: Anthranilate 1,2-dioxygenase electron transfer component [bacterium ADurb.Bin363]